MRYQNKGALNCDDFTTLCAKVKGEKVIDRNKLFTCVIEGED